MTPALAWERFQTRRPWRIVYWWVHSFERTYGKGRWWRHGAARRGLWQSIRFANLIAKGAAWKRMTII